MTRREIMKIAGLSLPTLAIPINTIAEYNWMQDTKYFEVIIIGGSYAGLSTAMSLGRSLRNVLVIDNGSPCNRQTPHSHNFITQDGVPPFRIAQKAKSEVLKYKTIKFLEDKAVRGEKIKDSFLIHTSSGQQIIAKKLVFATGIKDVMPSVPGFAGCWGITVVHCPYCHGYEFRDKVTGVLANGERAFQLAAMVNNLTQHLTVLTNGKSTFTAEQLKIIESMNINIIESKVAKINHENGFVRNVLFDDGASKSFEALYAGIPFTQHSDIPKLLGCELTELGHIKVDNTQKTTVDGIYACGDNSTMMRSIANAVFSGNLTGAMINKELIIEQFKKT
jgi:thioredoxin reductase